MENIWIHRTGSFKEAESFDEKYYLNMPSSKRLEIVQLLREQYLKIKKRINYESRKRLRRSIKIIR